jgi:hypothetical protein
MKVSRRMVAATTGGTMNISVWRRLVAPVAAIGVAIAMSVTASSAPANAANAVHAIPAAPPAGFTPIFHARGPATSGQASTLAGLFDITCYFQVVRPVVQGGRTNSSVLAGAALTCLYDIDGSPANVPSINLRAALSHGTPIVDIKNVIKSNDYSAGTDLSSAPCIWGDWTTSASVGVTFPPGYTPPSDFVSAADSTTLNFGDCPNDYVEVIDVTGLSLSHAQSLLSQEGLHGVQGGDVRSCDVARGTIAVQSPGAGSLALIGSTVVLNRSSGLPTTPCD